MPSTAAGPKTGPIAPRRQQILDAAAELFAQHGFRGVSIYDIGGAVGISGPALYRHFANKEAVLAEMLVGISERLLRVAQERVAGTEPGEGTLRKLVDWHVEFALDNPALITIQFRDLENLAESERRKVRRLQRGYVEIWADAIRAAVPGTDEPTARSAAHAAFGLINSTPHSARLGREATGVLLRSMALGALLAPGALSRSG
ncbi:TetR/AcrR family transcriptional regulator [Georgenia sp. AZ-5]|uniref:SACE_7040 family transcriptional regulator n=1 Tax=Georgenia sp. AZ-5 TaxID=3367526 RepID=UPI0037547299